MSLEKGTRSWQSVSIFTFQLCGAQDRDTSAEISPRAVADDPTVTASDLQQQTVSFRPDISFKIAL
jgi:hypothetical protein